MSRTDKQFNLRIPDNLRERLEVATAISHRSMTAEILARVDHSLQVTARREHTVERFTSLADIQEWATTFIENLHALTRVPCQQIRTTGTPKKGHVSYMSYAAHGSHSDGPVIRLFFNEQEQGNWTLDDVRVAL